MNAADATSADELTISDDRARLDVSMIENFLRASYWAPNIPREIVERSIENSLCFGAYLGAQQIGFARVITDYATFGYLADVFVLPEHQGRGIAKRLVAAIIDDPRLQHLRRLLLATRDAHGLYARFGFEPLATPADFMSIHRPEVYSQNHETRPQR